jgi:hypothetical protein
MILPPKQHSRSTLRWNASGTLLDSPRLLVMHSLFLLSVMIRVKSFADPVCALQRMGSKIHALMLPPTKSRPPPFLTPMSTLPPTSSRPLTFRTHTSPRNSPQLNTGSNHTGSFIMGSPLLTRNPPSNKTFLCLTSPTSVTPTENPLTQNHLTYYYRHPMIHDFWPESSSPLMIIRKPILVKPLVTTTTTRW